MTESAILTSLSEIANREDCPPVIADCLRKLLPVDQETLDIREAVAIVAESGGEKSLGDRWREGSMDVYIADEYHTIYLAGFARGQTQPKKLTITAVREILAQYEATSGQSIFAQNIRDGLHDNVVKQTLNYLNDSLTPSE